jgi:predicted RNase H-like nuclease (RuvC/YqgF family)
MNAKEWTLNQLGEMMERGFKAVAEDVADIKTEMIEQFEHVEKQFSAIDARLRDMSTEIAVIHRRVERLEEQGASNAGFAKEIDHLLTRVAEIEKHLGIEKKVAA